jgi:hypothetical protein
VLEGLVDDTTYEVDLTSHPQVPAFFQALTDGVDGFLVRGAASSPAGGGGYEVGLESVEILQRHPGLTGPDLAGATVERFTLVVTRGSVQAGDPSGYTLLGLVSYYGTVP